MKFYILTLFPEMIEQCLANSILLLAHYDVRIDFFPNLQEAFVTQIDQFDDEGKQAFETMCAIIRSVKFNWLDNYANGELAYDDLPEELRTLIDAAGGKGDLNTIVSMTPTSENEYIATIVQILVNTWVYETLICEKTERSNTVSLLYLSIGQMDMMWERLSVAEKWLLSKLRKGKGDAKDYINYGHCLLLRGDRMMAFENYREARRLCKSAKEFYSLFRPDRRQLVDHGIPVEQVYLIEDQLFSVS